MFNFLIDMLPSHDKNNHKKFHQSINHAYLNSNLLPVYKNTEIGLYLNLSS